MHGAVKIIIAQIFAFYHFVSMLAKDAYIFLVLACVIGLDRIHIPDLSTQDHVVALLFEDIIYERIFPSVNGSEYNNAIREPLWQGFTQDLKLGRRYGWIQIRRKQIVVHKCYLIQFRETQEPGEGMHNALDQRF